MEITEITNPNVAAYKAIEQEHQTSVYRESYIRSWETIQHLIDCVHDIRGVPGNIDSATILLSDEGRAELRNWMNRFENVISMMITFNGNYTDGRFQNVDHEAWRKMDTSALLLVNTLEKCLTIRADLNAALSARALNESNNSPS
jgi:hypothetical protein